MIYIRKANLEMQGHGRGPVPVFQHRDHESMRGQLAAECAVRGTVAAESVWEDDNREHPVAF